LEAREDTLSRRIRSADLADSRERDAARLSKRNRDSGQPPNGEFKRPDLFVLAGSEVTGCHGQLVEIVRRAFKLFLLLGLRRLIWADAFNRALQVVEGLHFNDVYRGFSGALRVVLVAGFVQRTFSTLWLSPEVTAISSVCVPPGLSENFDALRSRSLSITLWMLPESICPEGPDHSSPVFW